MMKSLTSLKQIMRSIYIQRKLIGASLTPNLKYSLTEHLSTTLTVTINLKTRIIGSYFCREHSRNLYHLI